MLPPNPSTQSVYGCWGESLALFPPERQGPGQRKAEGYHGAYLSIFVTYGSLMESV
jgi:hypothetical protein